MRKTLIGFASTIAAVAVLAVPSLASASSLTTQQVNAIVGLLQSFGASSSVIANVEAALNGQPVTTSSASCLTLTYNLYAGQTDANTGGQVTQLQQFLGVSQTGYFGPMTQQAVQSWQAAHSIVSSGSPDTTGYGFVGPATRTAMACGSIQSVPIVPVPQPTPPTSSASSGSASLDQNGQTIPVSPFTLSGSASNANSVTLAIVNSAYSGGLDYTSLRSFEATNPLSSSISVNFSQPMTVNGGRWQFSPPRYLVGTFTVVIYDSSSHTQLAIGQITVTASSQPPQTSVQSSGSGSATVTSAASQQMTFPSVLPGYPASPYGNFTLTGTAANTSKVTVLLIENGYTGATDWNTIASNLKGGAYDSVSNTVAVSNGNWSAPFGGMAPGTYHIYIYNDAAVPSLIGSSSVTAIDTRT